MPDDQPEWIHTARRQLGRHIQNARLDAGLTQEQLVERVPFDRSTLQRIEGGHSDPKYSQLLHISRALNLHVRDLLP